MQALDLDRSRTEIILIVDDVPENLSVLHDALDESGFTVLVAINGESALARARQSLPDIILLDAMMPGMDGFEVARRLKADFSTRHIPIIFMTGLTETEHVVAAFAAGGTDYVIKPVRTGEVIARVHTHLASAREMKQARSALDAFGQATLAVRPESGRITWQTPLARRLIADYFSGESRAEHAPATVMHWLDQVLTTTRGLPPQAPMSLNIVHDARRLSFTLHEQTADGEWLIVLREENDAAQIEALLAAFPLTRKEAEVLYWVTRGKTSPDIGEILGSSPRTVNKHLEHVYEKLGVENRTAAAKLALERLRG
ncbi:MAG: DNA-binding response regulator [Candidatus Dactylopiibacterium carminicum]|uniref:DNA-binding response regulator n=1 Tax=Candidatus Dactylopiibacterium carminicum TaxID=857335 RepID=A0A272EXD6_9RHOO|nr:response regulator transcription factor [Candidatus Dactylopiibacterium carminicum]KAF7600199.1 DNA-binding response regulator [Candidatus Dactylopiibacterium carminicum]PAS94782.1 MAG: DNA-binding response regulator [Candidatus Dactylopiibacterium carminicum]PAS97706.1 MAG: DNA-binding response regulator [Candidatus Dactylopiibacterium carminicum]PAT00198.1 MAG: DNA-binding response regulator [Candidatus Dactylopiibacterium carminicum]